MNFRDRRAGDGRDQFGPVPRDALLLILLTHHEAGDVLQEDEWDAPLAAELDKVRAFLCALREEDAVVGDYADGIAHPAREATDQGRAEQRLELMEAAAVYEPRDDLTDLEGLARVARQDAIEFGGIVERILRGCEVGQGDVFLRLRPATISRTRRSASASSSAR